MPPPAVQTSTSMEQNTSIFDLPQSVGFPPALLDAYSRQMKKVRGPKLPQPTVREQENSIQDEDQYSGTEISPGEAARIRDEVQGVMKQQFVQARAHAEAISNLEKKIAAQESRSKSVNATAEEDEVIDLISKSAASLQKSPPSVLPGSPISVASTPSHVGNGGSAPGFSQLSSGSHPSPPPPPFATMHWKPKEPPCFFGRSSEDVHTWTSLVRHYLTFMGGSDAQQVAYSVTLLRESAHEWYIGYERRHRNPPSDWAQLCNLLLERFGSNIRSQEAQSQLMSITQGQRLVRDYASQLKTLLGRLDSYDESMMLNQFIWGLQPELARSVSLHYPKSIAQAVSLAETTELAVKASRRPATKTGSSGTGQKGPSTSNRGRGFWRGGTGRGRGQGGGRMGNAGGRSRGSSGGRGGTSGSTRFDPLACYRCGVRGHLARDCPQSRRPVGRK